MAIANILHTFQGYNTLDSSCESGPIDTQLIPIDVICYYRISVIFLIEYISRKLYEDYVVPRVFTTNNLWQELCCTSINFDRDYPPTFNKCYLSHENFFQVRVIVQWFLSGSRFSGLSRDNLRVNLFSHIYPLQSGLHSARSHLHLHKGKGESRSDNVSVYA